MRSADRMVRCLPLVVVATLLLLGTSALAMANPAHAAPKENGKIAFSSTPVYGTSNFDVYAMNPDGADRSHLTNHLANDRTPEWSPDGSKIAFTRQRTYTGIDVFVMNADGTGVRALSSLEGDERHFEWSPDSSKLSFLSSYYDDASLFVVNADGTGKTVLHEDADKDSYTGNVYNHVWSPDGSKVAFISGYDGILHVVNADGTGLTPIAAEIASTKASPTWSPDGSKIAFAVGGDIYAASPDGTGLTNLTNSPEQEETAKWSPDGSKIAFTDSTFTTAPNISYYATDIYVMNPDGTGRTQIYDRDTSVPAWEWSPDGSKIAFRATDYTNDPAYVTHLSVVDANGTDLRTLDSAERRSGAGPFAWSPDSSRVAFSAIRDANGDINGDIYAVNADGTNLSNLTNTPDTSEGELSWQALDAAPPSVKLIEPAAGASVGGTVTLSAEATDNVAVKRVEFLIDAAVVGADDTAPYSVEWNTEGVADGEVAITARATDANALAATSEGRTVIVDNTAPTPSCTISGTSGAETISGTSGDDVICAGGGNDTIKGLGGNDTLMGEDGNDTLVGGAGNDSLDGGLGTDKATYSASAAAVVASLASGSATGEGSDSFSDLEGLVGSKFADTITGSAANNTLNGGSGNDTVGGEGGNDVLGGGLGDDGLDGGIGTDKANYAASLTAVIASLATGSATGEGSDTFSGVENLQGSNFADTITGSVANNVLGGGAGNDRVTGGAGADTLKGEAGDDAVDSRDGVSGNDSLDGGVGTDTKVTDATEKSVVGFP